MSSDESSLSGPAAVSETAIEELPLIGRGKVRDIYDLGDRLLIVASDRISAFDSVLGSPIPDKGRVLTQLSLFWFERLKSVIDNHLTDGSVDDLPVDGETRALLAGRSMIVKKTDPLPVECVVRGYLIGSGWKEYQASGSVCGIPLPAGLEMGSKLPEPIYTPSTKAESGHDENITYEETTEIIGAETAARLRDASLELYTRAADYALSRGIIIADTKFEFGLTDDGIILIDEILTPDSSRFWPADGYRTGISPPSFDKQYVRDWLERDSGWDKEPPAPRLPDEVVRKTREKYLEAYERLTGQPLPDAAE
jgi:phosphoribosylaminoimidazole-succinocarboxamide synthase